MKKHEIKILPEYFEKYIQYVPDIDLDSALQQFGGHYLMKERDNLNQLGHRVYSPGKWTVHDIIQHITDTERIFSYRALRIARHDKTTLPGFDENLFASNAHASSRDLDDLLDEFDLVRRSTIKLFNSFSEADMHNEGFIFKSNISVIALGFTITGHVMHHLNILSERYYPLLNEQK
jgi:hypothetical protein